MKAGRVLAGMIMAVILAIWPGIRVLAEEPEVLTEGEEQAEQEKTPEQIAAEEQARKNASYEVEVDSNLLPGWAQGPKVYAASAIVMDMESGAVLYAKKAEEQHFPASITKLLTTLVALEEASLTDPVVFSEDSISFLQYDDANIGMKPGEQISMNDALYAVLLASANEVSYAVAENTGNTMGGGYDTFIQRMNERAAELGCTGSHWVNANGLHDDAHYTTAHDMARIGAAVYQREEFHTIMGNLEYRIPPTNLVPEERVFQQNHKMLWPENYYYYEYCRGGKTGYTDQSGTTLVTLADNGTMRLAAVVMADYGVDAYEDTRAMLDYAFGNFQKVTVADKEVSGDIASFSDENAYVVLPAGIAFSQLESEIYAEEAVGESNLQESSATGTIVYRYGGQEVGHAIVTLQPDFFEEEEPDIQEKPEVPRKNVSEEKTKEKQTEVMIPIREFAAAVVAALVIVGSVLFFIKRKRKKERRRRSRRTME
ncbi:MAG: D-alanyl-D-alanine carboxypeptidase [Ruminococcus sp.]|nr:D-alanyl-D-alanine carboxypeptidase [Ruminococcus sp.]